ncbi:hypothetical protein [Bosea sp. Leaf344]|uniref:hypothetical protein n=1 Tax=Bosea sp. Leaf344 TaxID=1736346 RepID=UPI000AA63B18|nr:hypothetical protein [Bosea sp. Leaf344]
MLEMTLNVLTWDSRGGAKATRRPGTRLKQCLWAAALLPALSGHAGAQDWQRTTRYDAGGSVTTFRWLRPEPEHIAGLRKAAPPNNCAVLAFEVLNPKRGEARCVGYVPPYFPP